jgi:benzylsuccinate CoA-transferase BbsF subunit
MNELSLSGIRIVDFSWVMAGPMTTKMLGAMGAEIIKIESSTRPEFSVRDGMFSVINNNKKSCTLNITTPEGQDLIRELVASSHVVVENFSSRVLAQYGLSYDRLREVKPDIMFVSASGMGRTGPERDLLAYGSLLQGYSGRVGMIGEPNPALEAMGILPAWTDPITALWETMAILTAVRHWRQTGQGAYIDLSMLEATVALLPEALLHAALGEDVKESRSTTEPGASPSGVFRCAGADEWLALSVHTDEEWRGLCRVVGDADFAAGVGDHAARLKTKSELNARLGAWLRSQDAGAMEKALHANGVPAARSRNMAEIVADPHMRERALFREIDGTVEMATLPWLASDHWRGEFAPTPTIGRDNDYVFGTLLGLSAERRAELAEAGAIR